MEMEINPIVLDYAMVAFRMLNNKHDVKQEEEFWSMLDLVFGFIPESDIHSIHISGEVPNVFALYGKE